MTTSIRNLVFAAAVTAFAACEDKPATVGDKIETKVDDALDRRPLEKVQDAAEDAKAAAKDAAN